MDSVSVGLELYEIDDSVKKLFDDIKDSYREDYSDPDLSLPGIKESIVEDLRANSLDFSRILADWHNYNARLIYNTIESTYNDFENKADHAAAVKVSFEAFWQGTVGKVWAQAFIKFNRADLFQYFAKMGKPLPKIVGRSFQLNSVMFGHFSCMDYALGIQSFDCLEYFLFELKMVDYELFRKLITLNVGRNAELLPLYRQLSMRLISERADELLWHPYLRKAAQEAGNQAFVERFDYAVAMWRKNLWRNFVNFPYTVYQVLQDNPKTFVALAVIFLTIAIALYKHYHSQDRLVGVLTNRVRVKFKPAASARYFKNLSIESLEIKYQRTLTNGHHQLSLHVKQGGLKPEAQAHLLRIVDKVIEAYFTPTKGYSTIYDNKPICGKSFTALPGGNGFKVDITLPSLWANSKKQNQALKRLKFQFRRSEQIKLQEELKIRAEKALTWLQQRAESQKTARNSASPRIFQSVSYPQPLNKSTKKRSGPARHRPNPTGSGGGGGKRDQHRRSRQRYQRNNDIREKQLKDRLADKAMKQLTLKTKTLLEEIAAVKFSKDRLEDFHGFDEVSIGSELDQHEQELASLQRELVELYGEEATDQFVEERGLVAAAAPSPGT